MVLIPAGAMFLRKRRFLRYFIGGFEALLVLWLVLWLSFISAFIQAWALLFSLT